MQRKLSFYLIILSILLITIALVSIFIGVYKFEDGSIQTIIKIIFTQEEVTPSDSYVFLDVRLPRVIMAILVGAALSLSGTTLQGMFKNPLASPDLIGVTAGSVLFAAITIVLGHYIKAYIPEAVHYSLLSLMSFIGAMITMTFVYRMSTSKGKTNVSVLLLSGVAITALTGAATGLLTYISEEEELRNLTFWTLGSLAGATWTKVSILAVVMLIAVILLINKGKSLNAMMLGENDAAHLGIPVESIKKRIVLLSALMVGTSVAFSGTIGFVGLIVPYILRLIFKSNYYYILPLSTICGSILLLVADTLSRSIIPPSEIPIGILTSIMGAPVFIAILIRFKKSL
ncbi:MULTISPECIES: FecCD family ABC transporter permease [Myroides]|uniref:Iron chelate uptake ABC transporter family permease subunit n=1 Tax=Myroides albus TaxID=2562892 RepID=A0A6I3LJ91_9FLAO|nr:MULTISPECIES: iron ABC transporter permease [Myroides]MTG97884.1 iron chelate uptake ABC transporter family permease subunit [Myroides albus]MVX35284.1 iron chelate uptake ABC transporter family permease subunit [Myroides sp. LoEW2-1]UVD81071.1 iron ABC transporter permease [Myroides albus]